MLFRSKQEAEGYMEQAQTAADMADYVTAKKYYLLAKDVYASLKMEDKVDEITRKMDALDIRGEVKEEIKEEEAEDGEIAGL